MRRKPFYRFLAIALLCFVAFLLFACQSATPRQGNDPSEPAPTVDPTAPADPEKRDPTPDHGNSEDPSDPTSSPTTPGDPSTPATPSQPTEPVPDDPQGDPTEPSPTEPAHEHSYGEWFVVTPSTCLESGLKKRVCACGAFETEETGALGHDFHGKICARCGLVDPYGDYYGELSENRVNDGTRTIVTTARETLTLRAGGTYVLVREETTRRFYESVTVRQEEYEYVLTVDDEEISTADFLLATGRARTFTRTSGGVTEEIVLCEPDNINDPICAASYERTERRTVPLSSGTFRFAEDRTRAIAEEYAYTLDAANDAFTAELLPERFANVFRFGDVSVSLCDGEYDGISGFADVASILFEKAKIEYIGSEYRIVGYLNGYPVNTFTIPTEEAPLTENVEYELRVELTEGYEEVLVRYENVAKAYVVSVSETASCNGVGDYAALLSLDPSYAYAWHGDVLVAVRAEYRTASGTYADASCTDGGYVVKSYDSVTVWYTEEGSASAGDVLSLASRTFYSYRYDCTYRGESDFVTVSRFETPAIECADFDGYAFVGWEVGGVRVTLDDLPKEDGLIAVDAVYERSETTEPTEERAGLRVTETYRGAEYSRRELVLPVLSEESYVVTVEKTPTLVETGIVLYESDEYGAFSVRRYAREQSVEYDGVTYVVRVDEASGTCTVSYLGETYPAFFTREGNVLTIRNEGKTLRYAASLEGTRFSAKETEEAASYASLGLPETESATAGTYYGDDGKAYFVGLDEGAYVVILGDSVLWSLEDGENLGSGKYAADGYVFCLKNGEFLFALDAETLPAGEAWQPEDLCDLPARFLTGDTLAFTESGYTLSLGGEETSGACVRSQGVYLLYDGSADAFTVRMTFTGSGAVVEKE